MTQTIALQDEEVHNATSERTKDSGVRALQAVEALMRPRKTRLWPMPGR